MLISEWTRPLHLVVIGDEARSEERIVTLSHHRDPGMRGIGAVVSRAKAQTHYVLHKYGYRVRIIR